MACTYYNKTRGCTHDRGGVGGIDGNYCGGGLIFGGNNKAITVMCDQVLEGGTGRVAGIKTAPPIAHPICGRGCERHHNHELTTATKSSITATSTATQLASYDVRAWLARWKWGVECGNVEEAGKSTESCVNFYDKIFLQ